MAAGYRFGSPGQRLGGGVRCRAVRGGSPRTRRVVLLLYPDAESSARSPRIGRDPSAGRRRDAPRRRYRAADRRPLHAHAQNTPRTSDRHRGQALVEFAIVLPVFFLLVAGMFDFGLGIYSDLTLVNAAREGARLGVIDPGNTSAIEAHVRAMADNLDARPSSTVEVDCQRPSGGSFTSCADPSGSPVTRPSSPSATPTATFFPLLFGTEIPSRPKPGCASNERGRGRPERRHRRRRTHASGPPPSGAGPPRLALDPCRRAVGRDRRAAGQSGQALVLFALFFTVILGMAALVLDQGLLRKTNLDLHNALDSGALAGVGLLKDDAVEAERVAREYVQAELPRRPARRERRRSASAASSASRAARRG